MNGEQSPGLAGSVAPPVIFWFKLYAGFLSLIYLLVAVAGVIFLVSDPAELDMVETEAQIIGVIFLLMGVALFVACVLPFFLPRRPWVWIYDMVIICLGLTSACFLVICIPMLIFWLKPEAKAYFGRS